MIYKVFVIDSNGDGPVTELQDWDGEDCLVLRLKAFASDAVISIEPKGWAVDDSEEESA